MKFIGAVLTILSVVLDGANAFAPIQHHHVVAPAMTSTRSSSKSTTNSALFVNLPRLDLPSAVTDKLTDFDLKNPNAMNEEEYKSYSGAAIAGTLLFFLLPGAAITGILGAIGTVAGAAVTDFLFSALVGGGALIYLSLRKDAIGDSVREYGAQFLTGGKELTGLEFDMLRYDIPEAVTEVMTNSLDLINPNSMTSKEYDGYSGAAIGGTLFFFVLPGAIVTGTIGVLGDFASTALLDFVVSAVLGGGLAIYLSLRKDEIGATVNTYGAKLLAAVDDVLATKSDEALPKSDDK